MGAGTSAPAQSTGHANSSAAASSAVPSGAPAALTATAVPEIRASKDEARSERLKSMNSVKNVSEALARARNPCVAHSWGGFGYHLNDAAILPMDIFHEAQRGTSTAQVVSCFLRETGTCCRACACRA